MIEFFQKTGSALSGWVAFGMAFCSIVATLLYARFATRKQVEEATVKAHESDAAIEERLTEAKKMLEGRINDLERAADRLNTGLKNTPTRKELHEVKTEMERLHGGMDVLAARLEGMTAVLAKIEKPLDLLVEQQIFNKGRS